jgi:hypothetical protein
VISGTHKVISTHTKEEMDHLDEALSTYVLAASARGEYATNLEDMGE